MPLSQPIRCKSKSQARLGVQRFPALSAVSLLLLRVLVYGVISFLLAVMITFFVVLPHSLEKCSIVYDLNTGGIN